MVSVINVISSFLLLDVTFCLTFCFHSFVCQMMIGGQGGRGGESDSPEIFYNDGGERGSAYDNGSSGGLLPGSGGGGGAGYPGGAGGAGGGAILLYAEEIIINGVITVNGGNGGRGPDNGM